MSYTVPSQARARPTVVTVACGMLGAVSALGLVKAVIEILVYGDKRTGYQKAYAGYDIVDTVITLQSVITAVTVGILLLVATAVGLLAMFNARGRNPARITTWVLGGIVMCCGVLGVVGSAANGLGGSLNASSSSSNLPDAGVVGKIVQTTLPGWYSPVSTVGSVLDICLWVAIVILLALPASNEFFRKTQAMWAPPLPPFGPAQQWPPAQQGPMGPPSGPMGPASGPSYRGDSPE